MTTTSDTPVEATADRSIKIEYAVILSAALLLLTVPTITERLMWGPIVIPAFGFLEAIHLTSAMGGFALLIGYAIHARNVGWHRLGLSRQTWKRGLIEGITLGGFVFAISILWTLGVHGEIPSAGGDRLGFPLPLVAVAWLIALPVNSIGEELLRAYVIRRGEDLNWPTWLAACVSVLLFASYHTYYTADGLLEVTITGGVLLTLYYTLRRNLTGLIVAHTVMNYGWLALDLA